MHAGLISGLVGEERSAQAARLAEQCSSDTSASVSIRDDLSDAGEDEFARAVRALLEHDVFRHDAALLCLAARRGRRGIRKHLQEHVLGPLLERGDEFGALSVGLTLSDARSRDAHFAALEALMADGDDAGISALARAAAWWQLPAGHELERRFAGAGKTSQVALLRRTADGARFAWKIPTTDADEGREELERLVQRSREWLRLDLCTGEAAMAPDGRSMLQPWVAGRTLAACQDDDGFMDTPEHPMRQQLVDLLRRIVAARRAVSGLSALNLLHDGERWQVIDSGVVRLLPNVLEAWCRQERDTAYQWIRGHTGWEGAVKRLLADVRAGLHLPPLIPLRWQLIRLRRRLVGRPDFI